MEEGGSKSEFPLTHQLFMIGVGDLPLPAERYQSVGRHTSKE